MIHSHNAVSRALRSAVLRAPAPIAAPLLAAVRTHFSPLPFLCQEWSLQCCVFRSYVLAGFTPSTHVPYAYRYQYSTLSSETRRVCNSSIWLWTLTFVLFPRKHVFLPCVPCVLGWQASLPRQQQQQQAPHDKRAGFSLRGLRRGWRSLFSRQQQEQLQHASQQQKKVRACA